jgi:hypothetical protein
MSARDGLSALLTEGGGGALVVGADGAIRGVATIDALGRLLSGSEEPAAKAAPAPEAEAAPEADG